MTPELKDSILRFRSKVFDYTRLIRRMITQSSVTTKHFVLKSNETTLDVETFTDNFAVYVDGIRFFLGSGRGGFTSEQLGDIRRLTFDSSSVAREVKVIIDDFADRPTNLVSSNTRLFMLDVRTDNPVLKHDCGTRNIVLTILDSEGLPYIASYKPLDEDTVQLDIQSYRGTFKIYLEVFNR